MLGKREYLCKIAEVHGQQVTAARDQAVKMEI
jgi:hypothetical protein